MAEGWNDQLTKIIVPFETTHAIAPEEFWGQVEGQTTIFPEARRVLFKRLGENRPAFIKVLRRLAGQEHLDEKIRRTVYSLLARCYDCAFNWVEEGQPGKPEDFGTG